MKTTLLIATLGLTLFNTAPAQTLSSGDSRPSISVSGEAVVNVKPDKIMINFGVLTAHLNCATAKKVNNEIMQKALEIIKESGVAQQDVQTDALSINPEFDYTDRNEKTGVRRYYLVSYHVTNRCSVILNDPLKVENLVTKILQVGVNELKGIDFQTTELKKYREQARDLALKAAKEKAEQMAASLGQKIGNPITISESGGYYYGDSSRSRNNSMYQMHVNKTQNIPSESGDEQSGPIALGKIAIRANVQVSFELK